jgi:lysophospholipase
MALIEDDDNPIPPGVKTGFVACPDGLRLRYAAWLPETRRSPGTVVILQGRAE